MTRAGGGLSAGGRSCGSPSRSCCWRSPCAHITCWRCPPSTTSLHPPQRGRVDLRASRTSFTVGKLLGYYWLGAFGFDQLDALAGGRLVTR